MGRRTSPGTTGRLLALGLTLGAAAIVLASRSRAVADDALSAAGRVEDWVELAVVCGAALAAAWAAFGALLGLAVVASARAGARWRTGEAMVRAVAPGLVRRLVRAGIGAGVGTGLALVPTAAMAAPAASPGTVSVEVTSAAVVEPAAGSEGAEDAAVRASSGIDLSWRPTSATGQTTAPAAGDEPVEAHRSSTAPMAAHDSHSAPNAPDAPSEATVAPAAPGAAGSEGDQAAPTHTAPREQTTTQQPADQPVASAPTDQPVTAPSATPSDTAAGHPVQPGHSSQAATPPTSPPPGEPAASSSASRQASPGTQRDGAVVVLRGDTLWDVAARWLGGDPTDAEVMAATIRWHDANREVIGDDADIILPGQILTPPA